MPSLFDWSSTAGSNTTVDGININTGMPVNNTDNAFRSIMAIIRGTFTIGMRDFFSGAASLPVSRGGTGAATEANARSNLIGSGSTAATNLGLGTASLKAEDFFAAALTGTMAAKGKVDLKIGNDTLRLCWGSKVVAANIITTDTFESSITTVYTVLQGGGRSDVGDESNIYAIPNNSSSVTLVNGSDGAAMTIYWLAIGEA